MSASARPRIAALDLVRGVAILGILAVNIQGFAGPIAATISPDWNGPAAPTDHFAFAAVMVLFEGKMRAMLSLVFGASLLLFVEQAEAAGRNGETLQLRRLLWLGVIGYLHFLLLWWGDILFTYAITGFFALLARRASAKVLAGIALIAFGCWHAADMAVSIEPVLAEYRLESVMAPPAERVTLEQERTQAHDAALAEKARERGSFAGLVLYKVQAEARFPIIAALASIGETLPLMLLGMALYKGGFFAGGWPRRRMVWLGWGGTIIGGGLTLALTQIAAARQFPPELMNALLTGWLALPHLAMALGYAALLVLLSHRWEAGGKGSRIAAVGRMALSNYLGCTLIMCGLFYGWGLGLMGDVPPRWQWPFVLGGWAVMLWGSKAWLASHPQGPAEWVWRSLVAWKRQDWRRSAPAA